MATNWPAICAGAKPAKPSSTRSTILTKQHRSTSHGEAARNYAPKVIKAAGLANGFTAKELTAAMNTLFKDGRIKADMPLPWRDKWRHAVVGIGRC